MHDEDLIIRFIEGDLHGEERAVLKQHLNECGQCMRIYREHLSYIQGVDEFYNNINLETKTNFLKSHTQVFYLKYAAGLAVFLLALVFYFNIRSSEIKSTKYGNIKKDKTIIRNESQESWDAKFTKLRRKINFISRDISTKSF